MDKNLLDLYSNYLLSSFGPTMATGLSTLLDGEVSHDQLTRFLSGDAYPSKTLWQHINLLNGVCQIDDLTIPVAFELVCKPLLFSDSETGQTKCTSEVIKNELFRSML